MVFENMLGQKPRVAVCNLLELVRAQKTVDWTGNHIYKKPFGAKALSLKNCLWLRTVRSGRKLKT